MITGYAAPIREMKTKANISWSGTQDASWFLQLSDLILPGTHSTVRLSWVPKESPAFWVTAMQVVIMVPI